MCIVNMSLHEDQYTNLTIQRTITVNDLIIEGNLDVSLSQLHSHSHGEFLSNNLDTIIFLKIKNDGTFVEYGTILPDGRQVDIQKHTKTNLLFSDMHYDHYLNSTVHYRFTSDKDVVLLYTLSNNIVTCVPLYESSTLSNRSLDFELDMQESSMSDYEHPHFFHSNEMVNLIKRYTYTPSY